MTVYGEWFDAQMRERAERDGIELVAVRRAVLRQRNYGVRGYYVRGEEDQVYTYRRRRDGRVERSWVALTMSYVLEEHGALEVAP